MLKGQCHEIFEFWFFSWLSFPQAPEYTLPLGPFRIFSAAWYWSHFCHQCQWRRRQICRRYHWHRACCKIATGINNTSETGSKFANGVIDTGDAPWLANISANFRKNLKQTVQMGYSGAGGKLIHEKNQKQKISRHCPFKGPPCELDRDWKC